VEEESEPTFFKLNLLDKPAEALKLKTSAPEYSEILS
jgi:hypothetical protein